MKQFIPVNLDIDSLVRKHPPYEVENFLKDKLIHILHLIHSIPANNKALECINGFVPLYSPIIQRRIHNYRQYLDYLIRIKVIETNNRYIVGHTSIGYRFTAKYKTVLRSSEITNTALRRHQKREGRFATAMRKSHPHLYKWYSPDLQIDKELAMDFIHTDFSRKLANPDLRDFDVKNQKYKDPYNQFASAYINIERIADGEFMLNVDDNVYRLHSNITNLRSDIRHCLSFRGERLISIDIKNSQPYISTGLLNIGFWNNNNPTGIITINRIKNNPILNHFSTIQEYNSYIMLVNSCLKQAGIDLERFIELVTKGTFYEYLSAMMLEELGMDYASRKQVKAAVFQVLFTDNRYLGQVDAAPKRVFKDLFPSVYDLFALIKKGDKTILPRLLQRIESQLILQVVTKRIAKERPRLPIYTIHDSIATTEGNEGYVKRILDDELQAAIGYLPKLSTEVWHPSLMKFSNNQIFIGEELIVAA